MLSEPSSRTNQTRTVEARVVVLEMCTDRSSGTLSQSHPLAVSLGQARIL